LSNIFLSFIAVHSGETPCVFFCTFSEADSREDNIAQKDNKENDGKIRIRSVHDHLLSFLEITLV
jgi:hypothetical protein